MGYRCGGGEHVAQAEIDGIALHIGNKQELHLRGEWIAIQNTFYNQFIWHIGVDVVICVLNSE